MVRHKAFVERIAVFSVVEDKFSKDLAGKLKIPLIQSPLDDFDYILLKIGDALHLQSKRGSFCVDFSSGEMNYRREHGGGKNQAIARAIGLKKLKTVKTL